MIKKDNIVFAISSLSNGGAEKQFVKQVNFLSSCNFYHIHIILLKNDYFNLKSLPSNVIIHKFSLNFYSFSDFFLVVKLLHFLQPKITSTWLIHSNLVIGILAKIFSRSHIFWNVRGEFQKNNFLSYVELLFSYFIPNLIIVNSKFLISHYLKHKYNNIFNLVYNSFDFNNLKGNKFISSKFVKILYNARFVPSKNHDLLFQFVNWYNNSHQKKIKLFCLGKGVSLKNEKFVHLINFYCLSKDLVILNETSSNYSLNMIYRSVDLCLLLSKSEGFPNVVVEAILNKIFVLTLDFGAAKEIIKSNECIISDFSFETLADKINSFDLNKLNYIKIIDNNFNHAYSNFNSSVISFQLQQIYIKKI
jgi:glycosyltransferase involved in cell wall biosynthesis